ncbi:MAG: hypothetical protein AABY83_14195 [Pseudomonadota bacterium]
MAGEILQSAQVEEQGDIMVFRAEFATALEYVKHFPSVRGKILQIQLHAVGTEISEAGLQRRETLQPQSTSGLVTEVIYEGNVKGGPFLVLRFDSIVSFKIKEGRGKILEVRLEREREAGQAASAIPGVINANADDLALAQLLEQGRRDLLEGRYNEAIFRFSQIIQRPGNPAVRDAKEYLGVARERLGQYDLAKSEYEDYIKAYPDDDRTRTVQQRLMSVKSRNVQAAELRQVRDVARSADAAPAQTDVFGRVSSMYLGGVAVNRGESNLALNSFNTYFDVTGRTRTLDHESRTLFSGSADYDRHHKDYVTSEVGVRQLYRIRTVQYEYRGRRNGLDVGFGRQSTNRGGVLGRYDGAYVGYKVAPKVQATLVAGLPVDYLETMQLATNNRMAGVALEFPELVPNLNWGVFAMQQEIEKMLDRRALGADVRYFANKHTFFSFADYDVSYKVLNNITAHYGLQFNPISNISVHVDSRRTPYTLTSNAAYGLNNLQDPNMVSNGNTIEKNIKQINKDLGLPDEFPLTAEQIIYLKNNPTIASLRALGIPEDVIRERARRNSGQSTMVTLGLTRDLPELGPDYQFNMSASYSNYISVPTQRRAVVAEQGVNAGEIVWDYTTTRDYSVYSQLMVRNLWMARDMETVNVRASLGDDYRRFSIGVNSRLPYQADWNFDVRMRIDLTVDQNQDNEFRYAPSTHAEYRVTNKLSVEAEALVELTQGIAERGNSTWFSTNIGGRYSF